MKKTTLYITPPGAGNKKDVLFDEMVSLCPDSNDYSGVLYLGPNSHVIAAAKNRFFSYIRKHRERSAYIPFRSLTIKQLALGLHEAYGEGSVISDRVRVLIFCELLRDKNIGYAKLLAGLFKRTKHYAPDRPLPELREEIRGLIFEERARDRAVRAMELLEMYEDELKQKGLVDPDDLLKRSIVLIRGTAAGSGQSNLMIDGFFDPSPLELRIMDALSERAETTSVLAEEDTEIDRYFQAKGEGVSIKRPQRALQRKGVPFYSYPSIEDEVEGIAKRIRKLMFEGTRPWDITVCFPVLSKYLPMAQRVFGKYGLPLSIAESDLSSSRPFVALEEMITCMEEDYPRSDFLSVLTSPYFPLIPDVVKQRAVAYSYRAGIVKGKESWLSIKKILLNAPGPGREEYGADLEMFQKGLDSVIEVIEGLRTKKDILSFADSFESAITGLGFFDIKSRHASAWGEEVSGRVLSRLSELRAFANIYETGADSSGTPSFYLRYILKEIRGSRENRDGVKILPFELAADIGTKELFFGGIVEGDFPSRPDIDPILPERVKKALGMPHLEYYLKRQMLYFRRLLNTSASEPYFSCPAAEGDKLFLASPFLEWGAAMVPQVPDIFSGEEALVSMGALKERKVICDTGVPAGNDASGKRTGLMHRGSISVTDIDYYRKCPLRFYIEKVLGLEMETPPRFEVEARLWGSLAHKTMEYLFQDGDVDMNEFDERLFLSLERSLRDFPIGDFWSGVAKEIFRKLLPALKTQEHDMRIQGYSPYMTEHKTGVEINNIKLRGKIDRIDIKKSPESGVRSQENKTSTSVILLDYKTGAIDSESLQLPLYAAMWQAGSQGPVEKAGYYSLKEGRVTWYPKKTGMEEYIRGAMQEAESLIQKMRNGAFPAEPFNANECRYCCHGPLCTNSGTDPKA